MAVVSTSASPEKWSYDIESKYAIENGRIFTELEVYNNYLFVTTTGLYKLIILDYQQGNLTEIASYRGNVIYHWLHISEKYIVATNTKHIDIFSYDLSEGTITLLHSLDSDSAVFDGYLRQNEPGNLTFVYATGIRQSTIIASYKAYTRELTFTDTSYNLHDAVSQSLVITGVARVLEDNQGNHIFLYNKILVLGPNGNRKVIDTVENEKVRDQRGVAYSGEYLYFVTQYNDYMGSPLETRLFALRYPGTGQYSTKDYQSYVNIDGTRDMLYYNDSIILANDENGIKIVKHHPDANLSFTELMKINATLAITDLARIESTIFFGDASTLYGLSIVDEVPSPSPNETAPFPIIGILPTLLMITVVKSKKTSKKLIKS